MPQSYVSPRFSAIDANGRPLVGGLLYTYINGTTTPQATYQDAAGNAANTNPVILDARGEAVIFLVEGITYTFELRDAANALIWTQDSIGLASPGASGIQVVNALPAFDIGPVYLPGRGTFSWNGSKYVPDYASGFGSGPLGNRNKVINGDFQVWQRGASIGPVLAAGGNPYTADQWKVFAAGSASVTVTQQGAGADYGQSRVGAYTGRVTSNAAATPAAGDRNRLSQRIEGTTVIPFGLGTTWGGTMTLSFWVKASIIGDYSVAFLNGGSPSFRSYITTFSVITAGAWERKIITVPVDQSALTNWARDEALGLEVAFDLGSGTSFEGARDVWQSGELTRFTGTVRMVGTNASTFELSQVQLEMGPEATSFDQRTAQQELALCQRYFEIARPTVYGIATAAAQQGSAVLPYVVQKRAAPIITAPFGVNNVNSTSTTIGNTLIPRQSYIIDTRSSAAGPFSTSATIYATAEL